MKRTEKVLLIVFLVVTLICGKYLLDYWQDSYENRQNYRQVEEIAFPEKDTEEDGTGSNADNSMTETEIDDFDYQALLDENADCIEYTMDMCTRICVINVLVTLWFEIERA